LAHFKCGAKKMSKNLFNFRPQGFVDEDIEAYEREKKALYQDKGLEKLLENASVGDFVEAARRMSAEQYDGHSSFESHVAYVEAYEACNNRELKVSTSHDGDHDVRVIAHVPKVLDGKENQACLIYAHGGGAVALNADMYSGFLAHMAVTCGIIVFNVDYRLAPETKCPNNVLDFYEVIKYVVQNASKLQVDPERIGIAGESGGGYICAGAMVELASRGEGNLVKLAVPIVPMLDDYEFSSRDSMTKEEAENASLMQLVWKAIGGSDLENMRRAEPRLFPGKANARLLAQMPPTIIWEAEFDIYITPATRFANKLRSAGRLLELVIIPGSRHASGMMPEFGVWKVEREAWRVALNEYLVKN